MQIRRNQSRTVKRLNMRNLDIATSKCFTVCRHVNSVLDMMFCGQAARLSIVGRVLQSGSRFHTANRGNSTLYCTRKVGGFRKELFEKVILNCIIQTLVPHASLVKSHVLSGVTQTSGEMATRLHCVSMLIVIN